MPNDDLPGTLETKHAPACADSAPPSTTAPGPDSAPQAAPVLDLRGYELMERLGGGGMGDVYRAGDPALGRDLAVKVMKAELQGHGTAEQRFLREARVTGSLQHPGIVPIHNLGRLADGRLHYTMRLVRGRTLADILNRESGRPEFFPSLISIFEKVCQAVAYAHSKGVLHRDLKPANIMVGRFGEVQVMDWGLAKVLKIGERDPLSAPNEEVESGTRIPTEAGETPLEQTRMGREMGTPAYMPPEQALGEWDAVDARADVFALGAILCEILTGRPPYSSSDSMEALRKAKRGDCAEALAQLDRCGADAALVELCRECLSPAREPRPRDAEQVAQRVAAYRSEVQERLRRAELERTAAEFKAQEARKQRRWILSFVVFLLTAAGISGWLAVHATTAAEAERAARKSESEQRKRAEEQKRKAEANAEEAKQLKELAEEQKRRAEQQAAIALAVNEFLQNDLLGQADISQQAMGVSGTRDPDVKVRTLLDRSSRSIESKFKNQPLTEAAIRLTIGDAYRALGRYEESHRHLERSLQLRTAKLGADHPDTLSSKHSLALLYHHLGKYDLAEPLYKAALQGRTAKLGADHPNTLSSKNGLAGLYHYQGKFDLAEPLYKEVLQVQTAKLGANHPDTLSTKSNLAVLYQAQRRLDLAETLHKEVLQARMDALGVDHPNTLNSKNNLAGVYQDQGKYALAEPLFKEVLQARIAMHGLDHPDTLNSKNNLAVLYWAEGNLASAERLCREVLEAQTAKLGHDHPDTLNSRNNMAVLYQARKKFALAEPLFKEVLQARKTKLGKEHPLTLTTMAQLSLNLLRQKKYADAEPILGECLVIQTRKQFDPWIACITRSMLGEALAGQKKFAEAEPLLLESYEGMKKLRDKIPPRAWRLQVNEALLRLVQLYEAADQKDKAADWRTKLEQAKASPKKNKS